VGKKVRHWVSLPFNKSFFFCTIYYTLTTFTVISGLQGGIIRVHLDEKTRVSGDTRGYAVAYQGGIARDGVFKMIRWVNNVNGILSKTQMSIYINAAAVKKIIYLCDH
jgi:hypothetical protein